MPDPNVVGTQIAQVAGTFVMWTAGAVGIGFIVVMVFKWFADFFS